MGECMGNITQEYVKELFDYQDGELFWKVQKAKRVKIGDKAGSINGQGRKYVEIGGKNYLVHRLIYLMFRGYLPKIIDHIDRNPLNNRIENLREVTKSQNHQNVGLRRDSTSGVRCVHRNADKWRVQLRIEGKNKCLGRFEDLELAELVAVEARAKYYGDYRGA